MWAMAEAISFGTRLQKHLRAGQIAIHPHLAAETNLPRLASAGVLTIHGHLNLSHQDTKTAAEAYCRFTVQLDWREQCPALRCTEKWIRRPGGRLTADWHVNSDDSLCYILNPEWADQLASIERDNDTDAAITAAAFIAINNARWLLYRHLEGYRRKLIGWPAEWPQWEHGLDGLRDYARERRARG
jgi:hypothetical protein